MLNFNLDNSEIRHLILKNSEFLEYLSKKLIAIKKGVESYPNVAYNNWSITALGANEINLG